MAKMGAKICVDTDVIIEVLRGHEPAVGRIRELEEEGATFSTTSINVFELYYGALKSRKAEQNLNSVGKLLERLVILDFTAAVAERAGEILTELEAKGRAMALRDLFIGTTALVNGYTLLTRNVEHFKRIEGLKLLTVP